MERELPSADQAATTPQPSTEQLGEDTGHCRRILRNLMDIGNELAAMVARQALAQEENPPEAQKSVAAYNSVAQSVRRTILLHDKLGKPAKPPANRTAARKRIIRDVEDVIQRKAPAEHQESLHAELLERLDSPDLEDEIADRPIAEIITDICRDLAIAALPGTHPWKRRIPHDIAILNARAAGRPGQPPSAELAALLAAPPARPAYDPPANIPEDDIELVHTILRHYDNSRYYDNSG
jgi:hypothetical protein